MMAGAAAMAGQTAAMEWQLLPDPENQCAGDSSQPHEDRETDMTGRADGQDRRSPVTGAEDLPRLQRMEPLTDASTWSLRGKHNIISMTNLILNKQGEPSEQLKVKVRPAGQQPSPNKPYQHNPQETCPSQEGPQRSLDPALPIWETGKLRPREGMGAPKVT